MDDRLVLLGRIVGVFGVQGWVKVESFTEPRDNILRYKSQLRQLGLAHDQRRSVATTDVDFYRWTQWIFLQIYNSWYDGERARPVAELEALYAAGERPTPDRSARSSESSAQSLLYLLRGPC